MWQQVLGVHLKLQTLDFKVYVDTVVKHNFDIALCSWIAQYIDPTSLLVLFKENGSEKNHSLWEHPDYIEALNSAALEPNTEKRFDILEKAEEIFAKEMPAIPLFHDNSLYLQRENIKNLYISPLGLVYIHNVSIE